MPVLSAFKPPGVVYEMGHPVPHLQGRPDADIRARRHGPLVSALNDAEIAILRKHPRLELEVRGEVEGFNVERFRNESLKLVVIRPRPGAISPDGGPAPAVARGRKPAEAPLVE